MYIGRFVIVGRTQAGEWYLGYRVSSRSYPNRRIVVQGDRAAVLPTSAPAAVPAPTSPAGMTSPSIPAMPAIGGLLVFAVLVLLAPSSPAGALAATALRDSVGLATMEARMMPPTTENDYCTGMWNQGHRTRMTCTS